MSPAFNPDSKSEFWIEKCEVTCLITNKQIHNRLTDRQADELTNSHTHFLPAHAKS